MIVGAEDGLVMMGAILRAVRGGRLRADAALGPVAFSGTARRIRRHLRARPPSAVRAALPATDRRTLAERACPSVGASPCRRRDGRARGLAARELERTLGIVVRQFGHHVVDGLASHVPLHGQLADRPRAHVLARGR